MMAKGDEQLGKLLEMENMAAGMMPAATPFSDVLDHGGTAGIFSHYRVDDEPRNGASLGGFLELLGLSPSSLLDFSLPPPLPPTPPSTEIPLPLPAVSGASDAATFPVTPNSSSISASCNTEATGANDGDQPRSAVTTDTEASGDEKEKEGEQEKPKQTSAEEEEEEKKKKKKKGKRQREPQFAFVTKSDVDHLDDGYRWRKYGQKPVKNSPFPRSYYRCTTAACGVKKRVERSSSDPMVVVTTYEGQHTHPCPVSRGGGAGHNYAPSGFGSGGAPPLMPPPAVSTSPLLGTSHHYRQQQQLQQLPLHGGGLKPPLEFTLIRPVDVIGSGDFVRGDPEGLSRSQPRRHPMHAMEGSDRHVLGGDRGLLQDLVLHGVVRNGVLE